MYRLLLGFLILLGTGQLARAIMDPHDPDNPLRCRSCHTEAIHQERTDTTNYHLLTDTIDGVCLICHIESDCCVLGAEHQRQLYLGKHSHASGQHVDDLPRAHRPNTLPLFNDLVTCNTCHYHDRNRPRDYKLVRLAVVSDTGVDWTPLCHDCHDEY